MSSNTKVALCPSCRGRRLILRRWDVLGHIAAYWFMEE